MKRSHLFRGMLKCFERDSRSNSRYTNHELKSSKNFSISLASPSNVIFCANLGANASKSISSSNSSSVPLFSKVISRNHLQSKIGP